MTWTIPTDRTTVTGNLPIQVEHLPGDRMLCHLSFAAVDSNNWLLETRRTLQEMIREESERQLETHPAIERLRTAQATYTARVNALNESEARIVDLKSKAESIVESGPDDMDDQLDKLTKQISNERIKSEAIENVLPSLQAAVQSAEIAASEAVRLTTVTATIHARLMEQRNQVIANINAAIAEHVDELAKLESQISAVMLGNQTTLSTLQREYAPSTSTRTSPPATVKSHSERKLENV